MSKARIKCDVRIVQRTRRICHRSVCEIRQKICGRNTTLTASTNFAQLQLHQQRPRRQQFSNRLKAVPAASAVDTAICNISSDGNVYGIISFSNVIVCSFIVNSISIFVIISSVSSVQTWQQSAKSAATATSTSSSA